MNNSNSNDENNNKENDCYEDTMKMQGVISVPPTSIPTTTTTSTPSFPSPHQQTLGCTSTPTPTSTSIKQRFRVLDGVGARYMRLTDEMEDVERAGIGENGRLGGSKERERGTGGDCGDMEMLDVNGSGGVVRMQFRGGAEVDRSEEELEEGEVVVMEDVGTLNVGHGHELSSPHLPSPPTPPTQGLFLVDLTGGEKGKENEQKRDTEEGRERGNSSSPPGMAMDESEDCESELLSPSSGPSISPGPAGGDGGNQRRMPVVIEVLNDSDDDKDDVMDVVTRVDSIPPTPPPPPSYPKPHGHPTLQQPRATFASIISRKFPRKAMDPKELVMWYDSVGREIVTFRFSLARQRQSQTPGGDDEGKNVSPPPPPVLPANSVLRLLEWICTAIRPMYDMFGTGIMDAEEGFEWSQRNLIAQKTYHAFAEASLRLLGLLLTLPHLKTPTIDMQIAWALATFLFPNAQANSWNTQKLFGIATLILDRFPEYRQEGVLTQMLEEMVKPLFVNLREGKTGRGSGAGDAGRVQEAFEKGRKSFRRKMNDDGVKYGDMFSDTPAYPWVYDRIETTHVLMWIGFSLPKVTPILPANMNNPIIPQLLVPPILALFDSPHLSPHRIQAVELSIMLLSRMPEHVYAPEFLKKKGLVNLLWKAGMTQMEYLPPLTNAVLATRMVRSAGYLLMLLLNVTTQPRAAVQPPEGSIPQHLPPMRPHLFDAGAAATNTSSSNSISSISRHHQQYRYQEQVKLTDPLPFRQLEVLRKVIYPLHATQCPGIMCVMCDILIALLPTLYLPVVLQELRRIVEVLAEGILGNPFVRRKELVLKATKTLNVLLRSTPAWVRLAEGGRWVVIIEGCVSAWKRLTAEKERETGWEKEGMGGGEVRGWGGEYEGWESWHEWDFVKKEMQALVLAVGATVCRDDTLPSESRDGRGDEAGAGAKGNGGEGGSMSGVKNENGKRMGVDNNDADIEGSEGVEVEMAGVVEVKRTPTPPPSPQKQKEKDPKVAKLVEEWRNLVDGYLDRDREHVGDLFSTLIGTSRSCLRERL